MSLEDEVRAIVQDEIAKHEGQKQVPGVATVAPDPPPPSDTSESVSPNTSETTSPGTSSDVSVSAYDPQAPTAEAEPAEPDTTGL